jgi:hypothetical protein
LFLLAIAECLRRLRLQRLGAGEILRRVPAPGGRLRLKRCWYHGRVSFPPRPVAL